MSWGWVEGRQAGGYRKLALVVTPWFDAYLLHFPLGSGIARHRDPVDGRRHLRLNVVLWPADRGGRFAGPHLVRLGDRIVLFRPDRDAHEVSEVEAGSRWVFSVGVAI